MKKIIIVLSIILLVISGLTVIKNTAARIIVSKATKQLTGLRLSMQSIKLGILKGLIDITGLKIYNRSTELTQIFQNEYLASASCFFDTWLVDRLKRRSAARGISTGVSSRRTSGTAKLILLWI